MTILLRRNAEYDRWFSNSHKLPEGTVVRCVSMNPLWPRDTMIYVTPKGGVEISGSLNCFDYLPKKSPEYEAALAEVTARG